MFSKAIKKWTILVYADGNNEMESIMYKSLLACEKTGSNKGVNIVFQIGRLGSYNDSNGDNWSGVRRYYVNKNNLNLVEDLGKSNMADPNSLYDFIKWAFENYKSEHYMVVLSDHGGDFIGCFTDLSKNKPYIMGIPEMIEAINAVRKNLGYEIDILILDMCYMNSIEVLYELGQEKYNTAKTVITYMDYAAYDGLNYERLISCTEKNSNIKNLKLFIELLIDSLELDFQAFEINNSQLEEIKQLFNQLAEQGVNSLSSVNNKVKDISNSELINKIDDALNSMLIYSKQTFKGLNNSIKVTSNDIGHLILFYRKLAFSKDNHWTDLLSTTPLDSSKTLNDRVNVALTTSSKPVVHYMLKFNRDKD